MRSAPAHRASRAARHGTVLQPHWFRGASFVLLAAAVVLGTRTSNLTEVALSLIGWLVLSWAAWLQFRGSAPRWGAVEWSVAAVPALLLVTQALPLPPWIFAALPGREAIQANLELAGAAGIWRPLSLDHSGSFRAVAAMLPAAAMLVCLRGLPEHAVLKLCRWLVGLACLSVLLGLLQVAGGPDSVFRFHDFHNLTGALGFFAYRNHQAAFLLMVTPVAIGLLLISGAALAGRTMSWGKALLAVAVPVLLLGIALTLSRAGVILGVAMLGGCTVLIWTSWSRSQRWRSTLIAAAIVAGGGLVLVARVGMPGLVERLGGSLLEDARWDLYASVAETAWMYQPVGAGLGAFEQAFQADPQNVVLLGAYMNHAHNEWLQLWLELGWLGAFLALIALAALARAAWSVWRPEVRSNAVAEVVLARAATISLLVATVHAYFDYSLRSGTNLVVFALLAALLLRGGFPRTRHAGPGDIDRSASPRHVS